MVAVEGSVYSCSLNWGFTISTIVGKHCSAFYVVGKNRHIVTKSTLSQQFSISLSQDFFFRYYTVARKVHAVFPGFLHKLTMKCNLLSPKSQI